jgi:hypothetical protein
MDDTNTLSAEEAKYFDTRGEAELPLEQPKAETPPEQKPVEGDVAPEAKAEPEKKTPPEIEVVEDDDGQGEPDARKYVKVGVLRKEREQRKALRNEVEQTKAQLAALQRQIEEARNPPREIQPEEAGQVALERLQQIEAHNANLAAKQNFVTTWRQKAAEFTQEQADFPDAYKHALEVRRGMYELAGFGADQVNVMLESEEAAIVERALLAGENPAKAFYSIAKKLGYAPKTKEPDPTDNKVIDAAKKLAKIADGMSKNKAVNGGGSAESAPSLQELADMDDGEFEKATSGKKWREMWG